MYMVCKLSKAIHFQTTDFYEKNFQKITTTVKLGCNEQLGTGQIYLL